MSTSQLDKLLREILHEFGVINRCVNEDMARAAIENVAIQLELLAGAIRDSGAVPSDPRPRERAIGTMSAASQVSELLRVLRGTVQPLIGEQDLEDVRTHVSAELARRTVLNEG